MSHQAVAQLVLENAERFGDRNSQQFRYLASRLSKNGPAEVLAGLMQVFTAGPAASEGSKAQELAAALLMELRPQGELQLESTIRGALPRYELSVEQFPLFLAATVGTDAVREVLSRLEETELSPREARARDTMMFWLRNDQPPSLK